MRSILLHAGFSAPLTWQVLQRFGVTNFAAAPTIYRALRASDDRARGLPAAAGFLGRRAAHPGHRRMVQGARSAPKYAITTARPSTAC